MSWVTYNSPLWQKDSVPETVSPLPSPRELKVMEKKFVNDAVRTEVYSRARKIPIIPPYDALKDKYASAYFQSPMVKAMMERNERLQELNRERTLNKLSTRRRCKATPSPEELRARRQQFVNDAVFTERTRNKYHDIIPPYDAHNDAHCRGYFGKKDIQRLSEDSVPCPQLYDTEKTFNPSYREYTQSGLNLNLVERIGCEVKVKFHAPHIRPYGSSEPPGVQTDT
ncbi:hypothetical protein BaRGS_00026374 [Batillaria attramentaria]|uniref:Uncharacterized protein n=1 Tax=Batillaria attramentaria TaxID=370345 RepID=A0ABD0K6A4_9CAEN